MSQSMFHVEVIRYGDPKLGVQFFGIFDDFELIAPAMIEYNTNRGGKYPHFYVTKIQTNPTEMSFGTRVEYMIEGGIAFPVNSAEDDDE